MGGGKAKPNASIQYMQSMDGRIDHNSCER